MSEYGTPKVLGAVMIVKNEEERLGDILSDIRNVVDEICIVDTGSSDGTIALAESFGARIERFPWCNDFSAARNHSLACAKSDYLLWLDADDRIDEGSVKALLKLKTRLRPEKDRAYTLKILGRSKDMPDTLSYQTRIIPNREGVLFEGRVHEQILPSLKRTGVTIEPVDITIMHTGYHDPGTRRAKARRNLDILADELRAGKDTASQHFFMAMACIGLEDYALCLEHLKQARKKRTDEDWLHFSYTISTECLLRLGQTDEALREITEGIGLFGDSPLLHYYLGQVYTKTARFVEAAEVFKKAASLPERIDSYPAPPDLKTAVLIQYGTALEKAGKTDEAIGVYTRALKSGSGHKSLYQALGMALLQTGRIDEALNHLDKARSLSKSVDTTLWLSLARIYRHLKRHDRARDLYLDILNEVPDHLLALAGIADASVELDDIEAFLNALERLMIVLDIPVPEAVIESLGECSDLCMQVADRLKRKDEPTAAMRLAETALRLDPSNSRAHLFLADLFAEQGEIARMLARLETALKCGAGSQEVLTRIALARQALGMT
ncbi:MAG TPA: tetratricopeptide repeat protein [Desulfomonilia bacterium]|nr:tetratricopeptide repeat protein [Desulfomonilia bacterium]